MYASPRAELLRKSFCVYEGSALGNVIGRDIQKSNLYPLYSQMMRRQRLNNLPNVLSAGRAAYSQQPSDKSALIIVLAEDILE